MKSPTSASLADAKEAICSLEELISSKSSTATNFMPQQIAPPSTRSLLIPTSPNSRMLIYHAKIYSAAQEEYQSLLLAEPKAGMEELRRMHEKMAIQHNAIKEIDAKMKSISGASIIHFSSSVIARHLAYLNRYLFMSFKESNFLSGSFSQLSLQSKSLLDFQEYLGEVFFQQIMLGSPTLFVSKKLPPSRQSLIAEKFIDILDFSLKQHDFATAMVIFELIAIIRYHYPRIYHQIAKPSQDEFEKLQKLYGSSDIKTHKETLTHFVASYPNTCITPDIYPFIVELENIYRQYTIGNDIAGFLFFLIL